MAEKKKTASKSQDKKENKNLAKENKVKNTKKKAVSTKKDTAKVVSKKEDENASTTKLDKGSKKISKKNNKEQIKSKKEALNAIDEELLNDTNVGYIKNQYKNVAIERINKEEIKKENIKKNEQSEVESKGALEELTETKNDNIEEKEIIDDSGIFSSKAIWYLFFILVLIIGCIIYVYNEDTSKKVQDDVVLMEENKEIKAGTNRLPDFSQETAVEKIKAYFAIKKNIEYNPIDYLKSCNFITQEKIASYSKTKDGNYYKTDILYDNLKKHFEAYITRSCFEQTFKSHYKNSSGIVYCMTGQGHLNEYEVKKVERLEAPRPTLKVTYTVTSDTGGVAEKTNIFEFQVVKGNWIIMSIK